MNPVKILLVEDDQFLRDVFKEAIEHAGYNIDTAIDGQDCLEKLRLGGWDVVFLDVIMPKMSGIDVIKQLKSENVVLPKHVIFFTNTEEQDEVAELSDIPHEYLMKAGMTPSELVSKVKEKFPQ